jgi:hypothetical protein
VVFSGTLLDVNLECFLYSLNAGEFLIREKLVKYTTAETTSIPVLNHGGVPLSAGKGQEFRGLGRRRAEGGPCQRAGQGGSGPTDGLVH